MSPPNAPDEPPSYRGYRYPEGGVSVTYEPIRAWCTKFGPSVRRRRAEPSDMWHLDEVQLKIRGQRHCLWRALDQAGREFTPTHTPARTE